jgi:YVTN family beta-propeller protein
MRISSGARACVVVAAAVVLAGCDLGVDPLEVDYRSIDKIVYSKHVQPLFDRACATSGCHDAATAAEGLRMDSWPSLFSGSMHGAVVVPFRSRKSHLIFHVNRDSTVAPVTEPVMPPDRPLDPTVVEFLMRWIDEGARNDAGRVAFEDPKRGKVYVTNQADDEVTVIDIESNLVMRMVPVGALDNRTSPPEAPHNVVVDRKQEFYYVNMIVSNEVWKFRVRDDSFVAKLPLGDRTSPAQIVVSDNGKTAYVSNFDLTGTNRSFQVFNTETMAVTKRVADQRMLAPHGVQLTRSGKHLWTANQQSDNLAVFDTEQETIVAVVKADPSVPDLPVGPPRFGPYQLVFSPDDRFAYVTCRFSNDVRVFDATTRELVRVIPVGVNPLIPAITPDGRYLYVPNRGTGNPVSRSVSVIRTSDFVEVTRIENVGVEPHAVAITDDGRYAYVSCENLSSPDPPHHPTTGSGAPGFVAVIDVSTNTVMRRIEVGAFAAGIAIAGH